MTNDERAQADPKAPANGPARRRRADTRTRDGEPQIGRALKSVYDQTVDEAIPSDLLDLLGRLD